MAKKKKKKKKSTSPRRAGTGPKPSLQDAKEAERILTIWRKAAKVGLGRKRFAAAVTARYEPRLRATILQRLGKSEVFDGKAEANTKKVAHDVGLVCALMSKGAEVKKDTFQNVFILMRKHPACPRLAGAGTWCDIQL
jgi:hypothetical protein